MSTVVRYALPDVPVTHVPAPSSSAPPMPAPTQQSQTHAQQPHVAPSFARQTSHGQPVSSGQPRSRPVHKPLSNGFRSPELEDPPRVQKEYERYEEDEGDERHSPPLEDDLDGSGEGGGRALLMSNLQNPNDALRLLASASSLRYTTGPAGEGPASPPRSGLSPWHWWCPVEDGWVTEEEAGALFVL